MRVPYAALAKLRHQAYSASQKGSAWAGGRTHALLSLLSSPRAPFRAGPRYPDPSTRALVPLPAADVVLMTVFGSTTLIAFLVAGLAAETAFLLRDLRTEMAVIRRHIVATSGPPL